jgi:hypothetical protein
MASFLNNLLGKNHRPLTAENIYEKIEFFAKQLLKTDIRITDEPQWRQLSGNTVYVITRLENMYLLEREVFCLAGAIVGVPALKSNPDVINDTIRSMARKYNKLQDVFVIDAISKIAAWYQEVIVTE